MCRKDNKVKNTQTLRPRTFTVTLHEGSYLPEENCLRRSEFGNHVRKNIVKVCKEYRQALPYI